MFSIRRNGQSQQFLKSKFIAPGQSAVYSGSDWHINFLNGLVLQDEPLNNPNNRMQACNSRWACPPDCQTAKESSVFFTGKESGKFKAEEVEVFQIVSSTGNVS